MNATTLVILGAREIDGTFYQHGAELPPNLLTQETIDRWLDLRWLAAYPQRRSLYRLFPVFSGCQETEPLDAELAELVLPK